MFYDVVLEGLKKFAGEIIGVILLIVAWRIFPGLRKLFGQYNSLKDSEDKPETQTQDTGEVERLKEALARAEAQKAEMQRRLESKHPTMSDEAFIHLCKSGNIAEIEEAILNGANVNAKDTNGWPVLIYVVWKGYTEIAELLIKHGADVNARDNSGKTALRYAALNDDIKAIVLLLKNGADVNSKDNDGVTVLMKVKDRIGVAELLRSYGAKE
ncbi:MAG: ankyrin repeat domain-containing protein [Synergistaceae bacterium]|nr:ankyrin repeat domain-containing protein [Synergistaceae bacterium]